MPIHHTLAPHVTSAYLMRSLGLLLRPWNWQTGKSQKLLRDTLKLWFEADCHLLFSGREALLALLRACDFESGSEIIIQGYTCVALPNAIHGAGYTPVFVDIDPETLNLDLAQIEEKITHRTKAIICQHTFGMVADTKALREIADKHDLLLIEDCAHIIPDVTGPKSIGKYADAIMLSFGRDKAVSGIVGGAVLAKNKAVAESLERETKRAKRVPLLTVGRALLYPLLYSVAKPLYAIGIGKLIMLGASKLGLLIPVLTSKEKQGVQSPLLKQMPNASCALVKWQLTAFHSLNNHRRKLTQYYIQAAKEQRWTTPGGLSEHFPLQKFPLYVKDADSIRRALKKKHIYLDDGWTGANVCPRSVDQEAAGYTPNSCPHAEHIDQQILTLPTHPTMTRSQAERLVEELTHLIS